MAIMKCHECGNQVSTTAGACPSCGAKRKKPTSTFTWIVLALVVLVAGAAMFGKSGDSPPPRSTSTAAAPSVADNIREQRAKDEAAAKVAFEKDRAGILATMKRANANGKPEEVDALGKKYSGVTDPDFQSEILKADRAIAEKMQRVAKAQAKKEGVRIGMSKEEVLGSSWGKPQKINTTTNPYGTHEQWVYGGGNYLYFDGDKLTSIQN